MIAATSIMIMMAIVQFVAIMKLITMTTEVIVAVAEILETN